ncbi:MAG: helix-turn-helix transcriptional regulator [bacterium]
MNSAATISEQLKHRREELGLSLSEVARRAGTSPATLSRYENGWTRFETYTLRKLASALGCELQIQLMAGLAAATSCGSRGDATKRLSRLFWDHALTEADLDSHPVWVVERVIDYGSLADIRILQEAMGKAVFLQTVAGASRVSPRTLNFWRQILKQEGIQCTKKYSRDTAWNY